MIVGSELRIMARIAWRIEGPSPIHSPNQIWWKVPILCRGFLTNLESRCKIKAPARTVCPKRRRNCFYIVIANIKWEMVLIWGLPEKKEKFPENQLLFQKMEKTPARTEKTPARTEKAAARLVTVFKVANKDASLFLDVSSKKFCFYSNFVQPIARFCRYTCSWQKTSGKSLYKIKGTFILLIHGKL